MTSHNYITLKNVGESPVVEIWADGDVDIYTGIKGWDGEVTINMKIADIEMIIDAYKELLKEIL